MQKKICFKCHHISQHTSTAICKGIYTIFMPIDAGISGAGRHRCSLWISWSYINHVTATARQLTIALDRHSMTQVYMLPYNKFHLSGFWFRKCCKTFLLCSKIKVRSYRKKYTSYPFFIICYLNRYVMKLLIMFNVVCRFYRFIFSPYYITLWKFLEK